MQGFSRQYLMYILPEVYRCLLHWEFAECWNHSILLMHLMPCQKKIFYLYKSACIQAVKKNLATRVEWCSMVDWMNSMLIVNLSQCTLYVESVELFFEANDVGNWKHVSISLSNIGAYKRMGCCKARQPQKRTVSRNTWRLILSLTCYLFTKQLERV